MDDMDDEMRNDLPPADALGDDRPEDNQDKLNDMNDEFADPDPAPQTVLDDSDDESLLSEVDEAQFADFDPAALNVAPDFDTLQKGGKIKKRARPDGDEGLPKKKKERTREKVKKNRRQRADSDAGFSGGEQIDGKRARQSKAGGEGGERKKPARVEINEDDLSPEERRRRALDRAMDAAVKKTTVKRIKKGDIDLEQMADAEIEEMRNRMTKAAEDDGELVRNGQPASKKLQMLPEVIALLNRNSYSTAILDPEINLLEAVRFFLEPLTDGSLPAYNIQRELFAALSKLHMTKEALISSGIGKVIVFYRKSKRVQEPIRRQAQKLIEEWSRPLLGRSDDYTKKTFAQATYNPDAPRREREGPRAVPVRKASATLGPGTVDRKRATHFTGATTYKIVPKSTHIPRR
jgi:transcription factor SPN1